MRIQYKIFWVEDEKFWYDIQRELFRDILEDWGFELYCEWNKNIQEVTEKIKEGLQDYDLFLVDLQLNENETGNKIIDLIRDNYIYTDIIFYSSDIDGVKKIMSSNILEGVYISDREDIEDKFKQVAETTIKKTQEVNTIRGLLMAETSDLDELMLEIINKALSATDIKQTIENYAKEKMDEGLKNIDKKVNSTDTINSKINNGLIFTSFHKAKVINKICQLKNIKKNFFEDYNKDVIKTRNIFGHVKEEVENGKKVLVSKLIKSREVFDAQRCIDIRKTLIEYRKLLEEIKNRV